MIVVCIGSRRESEEIFEKISQIDQVNKMSTEQMRECMTKNQSNIRKVRVHETIKRRTWNGNFVVIVLFWND